jgi:DNA-binding transcriptional ArsR family regulator
MRVGKAHWTPYWQTLLYGQAVATIAVRALAAIWTVISAKEAAKQCQKKSICRHLTCFATLLNCLQVNMTTLKTGDFKGQAQMFKALGHPGRLLMLDELSRGERCVCELAALVGSEMPTVSRHLSLLKNAGIVDDEKRGAQVFYRLVTPCVMNFFQCVASVRDRSQT